MPQKIELVKHHKPAIGVPIVIVAAFFNAAMATMVKLILKETDLPNQMLVFFRFGISFFLLLPILFVLPKYRPVRETLKIKIWPPYVIRMIAGMLSLYAYFFALQKVLKINGHKSYDLLSGTNLCLLLMDLLEVVYWKLVLYLRSYGILCCSHLFGKCLKQKKRDLQN